MITRFFNGKIYIGRGVFADELFVHDDKISKHDTHQKISEHIDLKGKLLLPSFTDAHTHFLSYCLRQNQIDLTGISFLDKTLEKISNHIKIKKPKGWIKGSGWNQNLWSPNCFPTRHELDKICPDIPICLDARDYHSAWCNSKALELAGIDSATTWDDTGEIVKDSDGQPTGILKEDARRLVWKVMGSESVDDRVSALREYQSLAFQNGLSGVGCMETMDDFEAYKKLNDSGELKLRIGFYWPIRFLEDAIKKGMKSGDGNERLRFCGMKIFLDGTLGSQTAHMLEPFENSENCGIQILTQNEVDDLVLHAAEHNIACAIHAIGDAANRKALNAFEKAKKFFPQKKLRQRIEHAQIIHPSDIPRFAELGAIPSMQAIHIPEDIDTANRYWGSRTKNAYPFRSLIQNRAMLALGSDIPIETCNVFEGLYSAIYRTRRHDLESWHPEQVLFMSEAVEAYTSGAAYATGEESIKGTLESGKLADFMIVSENIFENPEKLLSTYVEQMYIGGECVYSA